MLRRSFCAGVALLLAVGIMLGEEGGVKTAVGKVVSLDVKRGVGTLTVMLVKDKGQEPKEMRFHVTNATKFLKGGGSGSEGSAVESGHVVETFKKSVLVSVQYEGERDSWTARTVSAVTPRPKKNK